MDTFHVDITYTADGSSHATSVTVGGDSFRDAKLAAMQFVIAMRPDSHVQITGCTVTDVLV